MCRPPCCNNSGGQGAGIAAVTVIIVAALVAAKIGPAVAKIVHGVLEVIRLAALTTGLVVALAMLTWAVIALTRWQLRRIALARTQTQMVTTPTTRIGASRPAGCLACGGTGMVLTLTRGDQYRPRDCPVCEPVKRAG
jgi:hypothetical protein